MTILNRYLLLFVCILNVLMVNGQTGCLDKKVTLPPGKVTLKTALKSISTQTGCVFSYDPTKIADTQPISISNKGTQCLRTTLLDILPRNIQFNVTGKYIVLQQGVGKKKQAAPVKPTKAIHSNLYKGTIDDNPNSERLVLPPLNGVSDSGTTLVIQIKPGIDSLSNTQERVTIQPDSSLQAVLIPDTLSNKVVVKNEIRTNEIKQDTTSNKELSVTPVPVKVKAGLGSFLNKNGYLELGGTWNKQLGAISMYAGLYDVYSILSIGSDYHDSYLFGIGIGAKVKLNTYFSLNFDLLQNSLIAGKSYLLNVRASNTQLSPILNITFLKSFKLFAGPTLNLIKSSYEGDISSTSLGVLVGIGFSAGVKIDLKNLLSKHS